MHTYSHIIRLFAVYIFFSGIDLVRSIINNLIKHSLYSETLIKIKWTLIIYCVVDIPLNNSAKNIK